MAKTLLCARSLKPHYMIKQCGSLKKHGMLKGNDFHSVKGIVTRISFRLLITHAYGAKLQIMLEFASVLYLNKRTISFLLTLDVDSALCSFFFQTN